MKSKGGSLYEVLKSASRPTGADDVAPTSPEPPGSAPSDGAQATLQERLAAYKAARLAAATQPTPAPVLEAAPSTMLGAGPVKAAPPTLVLEPDPTPVPPMATTVVRPPTVAISLPPPPVMAAREPEAAPVDKGPGERVVRLTYNTAAFSGMVAVGLLFVAYAVGLHVGKSQAAVETPVETPRPIVKPAPVVPAPVVPAPVVPPAPSKQYTIRLGEWRFVTTQEKVKAQALADDPDLKKALERAGHKSFTKAFTGTRAEPKMVLYVNRYTDLNSEAAKSALTAMKTFRFRGQTPFANAVFEEAQAQ
jgi:hypothetical protein